jgi:hypothetical protein
VFDAIRDLLSTLLKGTPEKRAAKLATIVVPGFVVSCILSQFTGLGMLTGSENSIISVRLPMYFDLSSGKKEDQGTVFVLEPDIGSFSIPWSNGNPRRVWLSLDPKNYESNARNLSIRKEGIEGRLPLLGSAKPVVLIAEGGQAGDPLLEGRSVKIEELGIYSREGVTKALWSFVVSMFGFGLVIRSGGDEASP